MRNVEASLSFIFNLPSVQQSNHDIEFVRERATS